VSVVTAVLLTALVLGWLRGGSLPALGARPLARPGLVVAALLAQGAGTLVGGPAYPLGLGVSALLAAVFLAVNRGLRGTGLVALGLAANALVVALNGAMPVSERAAARAGISTAPVVAGLDPRHEGETATTRLRALGDVVPVPLPVRPEVVSPGDVLVAAGTGQLVLVGMGAGRRPAPGPDQRPAPVRRPASPARSARARPGPPARRAGRS